MQMRSAILVPMLALMGCGIKDSKSPGIIGGVDTDQMSGCSSNANGNVLVCGGDQDFIAREITPYFGELKPIKAGQARGAERPPHANKLDKRGGIPFTEHSFAAHCSSTWGCKVEYAGKTQLNEPDDVLSPPYDEDFRFEKVSATRIKNFPSPAKITWKSQDGDSHVAYVDFKKILWEQLFIHHVPTKVIRPNTVMPNPRLEIFVDDRRIFVNMATLVKLKHPIDHAGAKMNPYDPELGEIVKVYERYF